jgi:hypothetical protein
VCVKRGVRFLEHAEAPLASINSFFRNNCGKPQLFGLYAEPTRREGRIQRSVISKAEASAIVLVPWTVKWVANGLSRVVGGRHGPVLLKRLDSWRT